VYKATQSILRAVCTVRYIFVGVRGLNCCMGRIWAYRGCVCVVYCVGL